MWRPLALCLLVVLAGCGSLAPASDSPPADDEEPTPGVIGEENGYRYDDPIAVNASDGLNETELNRVVDRAMARVEYIRNLEFTRSVNVSIINRSEYRKNQPFSVSETHSKWNNQVWEALFIVGEDRNVSEVFNTTLGSAVLGYYQPSTEQIVLVSDSDQPRVGPGTIAHELVHALQDQQFGLNATPGTQDAQLARNGVIEGEATIVERRYQKRCNGDWNCIQQPGIWVSGSGIDQGIINVVNYPYVVGPEFVETIEQTGGWEAVSVLYEDFPTSTEQISHPEKYPREEPVNVTVPDRSNDEWQRFDHDPVADTAGEASLYVMLRQNGAISRGERRYVHPATEGWGGDSLVPYRNGDRYGYVWHIVWDTEGDAKEFLDAYREVLVENGARRYGDVYTIDRHSDFTDSFRVTRDGKRVRIVNAPTEDELSAIAG